jgi:hypothetical protein
VRLISSVHIPQEFRVYLHSCLFPGGLSNRFRPESNVIGIETDVIGTDAGVVGIDALGEKVSGVRLPIECGAFAVLLSGSVTTGTGLLTSEILPSLVARFAAK